MNSEPDDSVAITRRALPTSPSITRAQERPYKHRVAASDGTLPSSTGLRGRLPFATMSGERKHQPAVATIRSTHGGPREKGGSA